MSTKPKLAVIGGGITGAFAAYFLAREGADVTLIERVGIGSQSSGRNPGGINPMHGTGIPGAMRDFAWQAFQLYVAHKDAITEQSGIPFALPPAPRIHVAIEARDMADLERLHTLHTEAPGFSARWLEPAELFELDARLHRSATCGLWTEGSGKVKAQAYTRAVATAAQKLGVTIEAAEVTGIEGRGGRAHAVTLGSRSVACDGVIVATGAWAAEAGSWLGCEIPLSPLKGELLEVLCAGAPIRHSFAWRAASIYGYGRPELWLGGNEEHAGFDDTPTQAARELILRRATELMPGMEVTAVTKHIASQRPMTPDDLPIIGLAPGWENVVLSLGGGRKGMLYGSAMGRAAADLAATGTTTLPIAACTPERFSK